MSGYAPLESEVAERAQRIRLALANVSVQESAEICLLARVVRVDDGDLKALSKYKLLQDLANEKPDPRNLKLANELGSEDVAKSFVGGLSVSIVPHTTKDENLANIINKAPERVVLEMVESLGRRIKKLDMKAYPQVLEACRELYEQLDIKFGAARRAKEARRAGSRA